MDFQDCYTINEKDQVFYCGKFLFEIKDWDKDFSKIKKHAESQNWFADIYQVNDHGNVTQLDYQGNEVNSWV